MSRRTAIGTSRPPRVQGSLSRERILATAVEVADEDGIDALSMRRLAQRLGVDPMSLYNHVRDKEDLLDGIADAIVGEIDPPAPGADWKATLRATILAARATLLRHHWAAGVIESRTNPGPATRAHMERVLATLRSGGLSIELSHHALHVLGSRVLGFSQDLFDDKSAPADAETMAAMARAWAAAYPATAELALAAEHDGGLGGCDDDVEFAFALDLILDGLDRRHRAP
jgi:AcrR family transcriptional regulator